MRHPLAGKTAIVIGAGITGLAAARVLSDRGIHVTLLERDAEPPARSARRAFFDWKRHGAPQVRHSHTFLGRLRSLLRDCYPDLLRALHAAGAVDLNILEIPPPAIGKLAPQPGDEDLSALGCRRTMFEWVVRRAVLRSRGVKLISGATVSALRALEGDPAVVTGVTYFVNGKTQNLEADFVVDASGRMSRAPFWLKRIGARPPYERQEPSGIIYYTRFYRLRRGAEFPPRNDHPAIADYHWIKFAVFPADDRTFSITLAAPLCIPRLKVLARVEAFDEMVRSFPGLRPFVDPKIATPIKVDHPVQTMGGLINRMRRFVDDKGPIAANFFVLGDAAYCTNPLYGRGCTQGFLHAHMLGESLDLHGANLVAAAIELDRRSREEIEPYYHASVLADRDATMKAEGRQPETLEAMLRYAFFEQGVVPAMRTDPVVFRAFARMLNMIETPDRAFGRPEVILRCLWVMLRSRWNPTPYALPPAPDCAAVLARCEAAVS